MYFTSGSDRAFEQLMQTRPGADHFDNGEAGAPEDCGTCRFYRPHWKYQFCVYEECPYQPGKRTALDGAVKFQVKGVDDEMAVFRVEKNRGYTVMSNHHLRNKDLSLKAKGLLSQMLSLPEDWDFTLKGLSLINREQIDAIRAAIRELEQAGYIVRSRERDSQGRLRGADYVIYSLRFNFQEKIFQIFHLCKFRQKESQTFVNSHKCPAFLTDTFRNFHNLIVWNVSHNGMCNPPMFPT